MGQRLPDLISSCQGQRGLAVPLHGSLAQIIHVSGLLVNFRRLVLRVI